MTDLASALYRGVVVHQRVRPRRHRLTYRVFSLLLDLDELPRLGRALRLFAYNRFGLFSFLDRDHGPGHAAPLRPYVENQLRRAGIDLAGGAIRVLCYPRILGYVFNPLSVFFCHHRDGALAALIYEVNNTFGERHSYLIPVVDAAPGPIRQGCTKRFYVSPFNPVEGTYRFRVEPPGDRLALVINQDDAAGPVLHAAFRGERASLSDRALLAAFVRYPLMTVKVIAGIHWEAFRLWRKGLRLVDRPAPPADAVTIVTPATPSTPGG
ncbi:MAG: DUF1365 domain-containing protein [Rhodospirillales bacterium]|nr:MAG: DUF1365 domain-containing protein [Rhodospirillales bacterium]